MQIKCYWVKQYNLDILDQISPKVHFQSKTGQLNITIEFIILELIQVTNFILNNFVFLAKFTQKGYCLLKTEKVNITIKFSIFDLISVTNCVFNRQFWVFGSNLPTKSCSSPKQRKWISLLNSTEFSKLE